MVLAPLCPFILLEQQRSHHRKHSAPCSLSQPHQRTARTLSAQLTWTFGARLLTPAPRPLATGTPSTTAASLMVCTSLLRITPLLTHRACVADAVSSLNRDSECGIGNCLSLCLLVCPPLSSVFGADGNTDSRDGEVVSSVWHTLFLFLSLFA